MSRNWKRYTPAERIERSENMKKVEGIGRLGMEGSMGWAWVCGFVLGWEGEVDGSGSLLTWKGETKAFPERRGPSGFNGGWGWVFPAVLGGGFEDEVEGEGGARKRKQPTVNRGSLRISLSSADPGLKSVRSIWMMGGGSTGRRSRSPAPHARAARGCCRMCRW